MVVDHQKEPGNFVKILIPRPGQRPFTSVSLCDFDYQPEYRPAVSKFIFDYTYLQAKK